MKLFRRNSYQDNAHKLYMALVEQARQPAFYVDRGVPDDKEGRFDMIVMHAFLVLRRLKRDHDKTNELAQAVFDVMFADMDRNLREMGVSDLVVGRRVKNLVKAFYGRVVAYEAGLDGADEVLAAALERNLFRNTKPEDRDIAGMIQYMRREAESLDVQSLENLMSGEVSFIGVAAGEK